MKLFKRTPTPERCSIPDCDELADIYAFCAGAGGLDPEQVELRGFCSDEHADLIPRPTEEAIARARARLHARARR